MLDRQEEEKKAEIIVPINEDSVLEEVAVSPSINKQGKWILSIYLLDPYRDLPKQSLGDAAATDANFELER